MLAVFFIFGLICGVILGVAGTLQYLADNDDNDHDILSF